MIYLCFIGSILLSTLATLAQCGCADRFETTFPAAVKEAPVVIEGEIKSEMLFFGGNYNDDYKTQKITVYKVLKGDFEAKEVELIEQRISVSHHCDEGDGMGIFILYPSDVIETPFKEIPTNLKFKFKLMLGIGCNTVNYNAQRFGTSDYGHSPYNIYSLTDIKKKVYEVAERVTGYQYKEIAEMPKKDFGGGNVENVAKIDETQAIGITSISPTTITAGTFDTLTVRGSGFGDNTSAYSIGFRNVEIEDEKYFHAPQNHIILHTDTLIKVIVPSVAITPPTPP